MANVLALRHGESWTRSGWRCLVGAMARLNKTEKAKLLRVRRLLEMGPGDFAPSGEVLRADIAEETKLWRETWILPVLDAILDSSEPNGDWSDKTRCKCGSPLPMHLMEHWTDKSKHICRCSRAWAKRNGEIVFVGYEHNPFIG